MTQPQFRAAGAGGGMQSVHAGYRFRWTDWEPCRAVSPHQLGNSRTEPMPPVNPQSHLMRQLFPVTSRSPQQQHYSLERHKPRTGAQSTFQNSAGVETEAQASAKAWCISKPENHLNSSLASTSDIVFPCKVPEEAAQAVFTWLVPCQEPELE